MCVFAGVQLFSILVDMQQMLLYPLSHGSLKVEREDVVFGNVMKDEDVIGEKGLAKHCS